MLSAKATAQRLRINMTIRILDAIFDRLIHELREHEAQLRTEEQHELAGDMADHITQFAEDSDLASELVQILNEEEGEIPMRLPVYVPMSAQAHVPDPPIRVEIPKGVCNCSACKLSRRRAELALN